MAGYSHDDAYDTGMLQVSEIHSLYYEQYGNQKGKTVLFLHGGPGGSTSKSSAQFFDPAVYRVILHDQRGAGRSTPSAELQDNTTHQLLQDIEKLRLHLDIPRWHLVFGGSWGSTLALLYAQAHPDLVGSLVVRGIFLFREVELQWTEPRPYFTASAFWPDAYEKCINHLPEHLRAGNTAEGYYKLLTSPDRATRLAAAKASGDYVMLLEHLMPEPQPATMTEEEEEMSISYGTLVFHYLVHKGFLDEDQILRDMSRIQHIPATIVQGRYDMICPPQSAWDLHKVYPGSEMVWVAGAGHSANEPGIKKALIEACDKYGTM